MSDPAEDLLARGYLARREHRLADARSHFAEAAKTSRETGENASLAQALAGLGQIERDMGDLDAAIIHYDAAVAVFRRLNEPLRLAHTIRHAGDIRQNRVEIELALPCYEEALSIYRCHAQTSPLDLANAIRGFALARGASGSVAEALRLWQEARGLYDAVGVQDGVSESDTQIASLNARLSAC
jgi:tetratricopeptide (TPR) repeat protein